MEYPTIEPRPKAKGISFKETTSRTKQSFREEANINNIMAKYVKTGVLVHTPGTRKPLYGNFATGKEYQDTLNEIADIKKQFNLLDSDVRERFQNDPSKALDFMANNENIEESIKLGLLPELEENTKTDEVPQAEPVKTTETEATKTAE